MHTIAVSGKVGRVTPLKQVGDNFVSNFTLASNEYKTASGEKKTIWFSCSLWGQHAKNVAEWIVVGKGLFVTGTLVADEHGNPAIYETNEGESRASFKLNVDKLEFTSPAGEKKEAVDEDDIPF